MAIIFLYFSISPYFTIQTPTLHSQFYIKILDINLFLETGIRQQIHTDLCRIKLLQYILYILTSYILIKIEYYTFIVGQNIHPQNKIHSPTTQQFY